ncbi:toprim domain-containing protein [Salipiger sp. 1_MG-2023]|uniref:toprim domain-containing protein n=1 Tax=Salipiger sp. 1_MG-2023 TaxID=3062665 RepID=UPI0026E15683|nr:toprim domain-containing protein [Salipiger sp. 1_MG-2023]MDO6584816.1 toprim domain-containing protein [Salipiger sp. 1_MG-2023]
MATDARAITEHLCGKWHRRYGAAPCPICQPEGRKEQNALTLADGRDGRWLLNCKKAGCSFTDILAAAGVSPGSHAAPDPAGMARRDAEAKADAEKRERQARALWSEARPIAGTLVETYLRARGITCALPNTLRFHPACWHPTAKRFPAMIARVDGVERFAAHRTYLRPDGSGKAEVTPPRAMLGAVAGGAVRLTQAEGPLVVAEGIETALSLACGLLRVPATIWAALSTSSLCCLHLPDPPGRLTIASDGDDAGRAAAHALAERAHALGWAVSLLPAPDGTDWNDILNLKGASA